MSNNLVNVNLTSTTEIQNARPSFNYQGTDFMIKFFLLVALMSIFSLSAQAAKVNGLGNDYEVFDFGTYTDNLPWYSGTYSDPKNNNWYVPAHNFKNPVYLYQLNPSLVQTQMRNMRSSGIDILVLHISSGELAACEASGGCYTPYNDGIWGYLTDMSQAALRPQQQQNLQAILQYATSIGFRKVFLRFGYADLENASLWSSWNEVEYQKQWNLIVRTHNLASNILKYTATRMIIDLGGEQIGRGCINKNITNCQYQNYVQRLWADYVTAFGTSDTIGFSFIGCSSNVVSGLSWYGSTKPLQYAFDVYGGCIKNPLSSAGSDLVGAWQALGAEKSKPVMVMETYNNDSTNATSFASAQAANPALVLTDIVQWPVTRTPSCYYSSTSYCDGNIQNAPLAALNGTTQVSNYLPIAASAAVDNLNPALLNIDGSTCTSSSPSTCAKFNVGYAPSGTNTVWQIWVTGNNGTRTLWGCNAGSSTSTVSWLVKGNSYRFDYYKASSCSVTPALGAQSATSYISLR